MRLSDGKPDRFDETSYLIRAFNGEERIAHRDFTPIRALEDDCLAELVDASPMPTGATSAAVAASGSGAAAGTGG